MEHNVLSTSAQQLLDAVRGENVFVTALKCINATNSEVEGENSSDSAKTKLSKLLVGLPKIGYLNESTSFHSDPYKSAKKSIEKGHLSQGVRIKLVTPMDWDKYSESLRSIRYKVQAWGGLDSVLHYDSLEEDDVMFSKAFSHIMDWINYFILDSNEDDFAWYDMAVGQRASKLAYTIRRAIQKSEDIEHIAAMIVCAEIHLRELMEEEKIAEHSNHGLFQMAGLLALAKSLPFLTNSESASSFAILKIKSMLENHFSDDFLHKEHSPMYHIFMTNYLSILLDSGFMADSDFFVELARGAIEAAAWFAMPNGMILPFGDTPNIPTAERTNFQLYSSQSKIVSPPGIKYFAKGGLVVHSHHSDKKGAIGYLAFNGTFHSRQHKHADDFNIQLFSNGESILSDPGTFTYQYDLPERMYIESTRAHNCLEIDGLNYSRFRKDAFGNCIQSVDVLGDFVLIDAEVIRKRLVSDSIPNNQVKMSDAVDVEITHRRKVIYLPDNFMLVVDLVDSAQSHTYRQWFQINPELLLKGNETELFIRNSEGRSVARIIPLSPSESIAEIHSGVTVPHMQGWASVNGHSLEKSTSLCVKSDGKKAVLATLFDLKPSHKSTVFFNHGTGGKYLRFSFKRGKSVFEYVSRTKGAHTVITVTGPNGEYSLST
jgi:hypothetical protein